MTQAKWTGTGLLMMVLAWLSPSAAFGQFAPSPSSPGATPPSAAMMMANPYLNPYMNPYLNPAATQQRMSANNALLYMYTAQAAKGGIGSGQLSNPPVSRARKKAAELPNSASAPGGGAARFFNPGSANGNGAGRYYNQSSRHFQNNGR